MTSPPPRGCVPYHKLKMNRARHSHTRGGPGGALSWALKVGNLHLKHQILGRIKTSKSPEKPQPAVWNDDINDKIYF